MTTARSAPRPKRPSMLDVASAAGVSRTTVSFVINEIPDSNIPPETQQRVWEAVEKLGYRPNAIARNLRSQRTHTIGFISDQIVTTPFAGAMIQGAQDAAWAENKLILLVNTARNQVVKEQAVETLLERKVDGILYASMYHREVFPPPTVHEVPTVLLDAFVADCSLPSVVPDEAGGGAAAAEYLIARGHRRIGMINNVDPIPATLGREQGFRAALQRHGLPSDASLFATGLSDPAGGYRAALELLQRPERPSALFCFNDRMAMGAYDAAADLGMAVGSDLAIVGFDNQETIAPWLRPALTTVQLPHYEMGRWAVEHLLGLIASGGQPAGAPVQHTIACPLVERSSA